MQGQLEKGNRFAPAVADAPSPEFIRAVADLLDTSAEDILTEMGYREEPIREENLYARRDLQATAADPAL